MLAMECLEEIPDDEAATAVFAEALRPGGLLLVHVPERDWRPVLRSSEATWKDEVRHGYTRDELVALLERHGLHVVNVTPTTRGTVRLAQEARDRIKTARLAVRAAGVSAADGSRSGSSGSGHLGPGPRALRGGAKAGVRRFLVPEAGRAGRAGRSAELLGAHPHVSERRHGRGGRRVGARPDAPALRGGRLRRRIDRRHGRRAQPVRATGSHYLRRENAGAAEAFNRGVEAASGDFVVVLDADDVFEPERIEALSELAIGATRSRHRDDGRGLGIGRPGHRPLQRRRRIRSRSRTSAPRFSSAASSSRRRCADPRVLARRRAGHGARGLRGLGLLDPDDPRRIEGRIGRRAAPALPAARRKRQLGPAHVVPASRRHARASPDESSTAGRRPRRARHGALATQADARARQSLRRGPPRRPATRGSWRSPSPATQAHGRKTRLKAAVLAAAPSAVRPRLVDRLGFPPRLARREVGSSD